MKILVLAIALLFGVLFMTTPKEVKAEAPECVTFILQCSNGTQHYVVICDGGIDGRAWVELLCGAND